MGQALQAVERVLSQSDGKLCADHALRHRARRLRVYALNGQPDERAGELAEAIGRCVDEMGCHLPSTHPELAFYRHWQAKALWRQASALAPGSERTQLGKRAWEVATAATDSLAVSHGAEHPTVSKWRVADADRRQGLGC